MKHETAAPLLNDFVDGRLNAPLAAELEEHARQCLTCRREIDGLRLLLKGAASLPRSIEPALDLWPAIAEATMPDPGRVEGFGTRLLQQLGFFSWSWPTALATAAVVGVLFVSSLDTGSLVGSDQVPGTPAVDQLAGASPEAAALVCSLEAECLEGERELAAYNGSSGPVTRMLKENMPVVDRAIAEARAAWISSPDEPGLARLLTSAYRAKMALQGRAIRMASES